MKITSIDLFFLIWVPLGLALVAWGKIDGWVFFLVLISRFEFKVSW